MEELAIKLAELLEISVEAAIKLYPVLREQYIIYNSIGILRGILFFLLLAGLIIIPLKYNLMEKELPNNYYIGMFGRDINPIYSENMVDEIIDYNKMLEKRLIREGKIWLGVLVFRMSLKAVQLILATDLVIVMDIISKNQ